MFGHLIEEKQHNMFKRKYVINEKLFRVQEISISFMS